MDKIKHELLELGAKQLTTRLELGKTIPLILSTAESEGVCLIALGARGKSLWGEIFIGGTANNIARHAPMPVLFVT